MIVAPGFRVPIYIFLWIVAAVLLGLTAARISFTNSNFGVHEQIVVELLVSSILTILWVPFAAAFLIWNYPGVLIEALGAFVLFSLYLAGASVASNDFPTGVSCAGDRQCGIVQAIVAFAWIGWVLLFFILLAHVFQHGPAISNSAQAGAGTSGAGSGMGMRSRWGRKPVVGGGRPVGGTVV